MDQLKDLACERSTLGGVLRYSKDAWIEIGDIVDVNDYTLDLNQDTFKVLKHIFQKDIESKIDIPTIRSAASELKLVHLLDDKNKDYLHKLQNFHVELENIRGFAAKIKRLSVARELFWLCGDLQKDIVQVTGGESLSEILGIVENKVLNYTNSLSANNQSSTVQVSEGLHEWLENAAANPVDIIGVPTGLAYFDQAWGGLRRKAMNVIGARMGVGKTWIGENVLLRIAIKEKIPVLNLDTEMSLDGHWPRILGILAQCNPTIIENGKYSLDNEIKRRVVKAEKLLGEIPYSYQNVSDMSFEEILSYARRWVVRSVGKTNGVTNDAVLLYDYFKVMHAQDINSNMSESQALGFQATSLSNFLMKYDISNLSFAQLNREGNNRTGTDVFADSDKILRFASAAATYHRKTTEEIAESGGPSKGFHKMTIEKTRYGVMPDYGDYININFDTNSGLIKEVGTRNGEINKATGFTMSG